MKILFFTSSGPDNLEDAYLHGLRSLYGADVVDYPKKEVLYKNFNGRPADELYGRLFTVWRTLDDISVDRTEIDAKLRAGFFDLIIFGSIHRTLAFYNYYEPLLKKNSTIMLDGEDPIDTVRQTLKFLTFKRELRPKIWYYKYYKTVPKFVYNRLGLPPGILPISFAIPKEKITHGITRESKKTLLPGHIVDKEVAESFKTKEPTSETYLFTEEKDYYKNLQESEFGITTKRGGWDCLRHYEIAANGAVMCFRDLLQKHEWCAPHGLNETNCVIYSDAGELFKRIEKMSGDEYSSLLKGGYDWIDAQATDVKAADMLARAQKFFKEHS